MGTGGGVVIGDLSWWGLAWPWLSLLVYAGLVEFILIRLLPGHWSLTERFREGLRRPSAWAWRVGYIGIGAALTLHLFRNWW